MDTACSKTKKGKKARHCPGALNVGKKKQLKKHGGDMNKAGAAAEADANGSECVKAQRCYLRPYRPGKEKDGCCPGQTAHHIPPKACFENSGGTYTQSSALCVCLEGQNQHCGSHGKNHAAIEWLAGPQNANMAVGKKYDVAEYNSLCAATVAAQCGCKKECIEAQLNKQAKDKGVKKVEHVDTNSSSNIESLKTKIRRRFKKGTTGS